MPKYRPNVVSVTSWGSRIGHLLADQATDARFPLVLLARVAAAQMGVQTWRNASYATRERVYLSFPGSRATPFRSSSSSSWTAARSRSHDAVARVGVLPARPRRSSTLELPLKTARTVTSEPTAASPTRSERSGTGRRGVVAVPLRRAIAIRRPGLGRAFFCGSCG